MHVGFGCRIRLMKNSIGALVLCLVCGCHSSDPTIGEATSLAQDSELSHDEVTDAEQAPFREEDKHSHEAEERVGQIRRAVELEAAALGADHWAGSYYFGDGMGVNSYVSIAPNSGFAFEWHGCLGTYDRNYGTVELVDGELRLQFEFPNSREGFEGLHESFVPIRWGDRQYLVAVEEMVELCNAVNQGEGRLFMLLKETEEPLKVFGKPNIPEQYRAYLPDPPLQATVTHVGESKLVPFYDDRFHRDTHITLNVTQADGARVGMEFTRLNVGVAECATITSVGQDSCEAVVRQDSKDEPPTTRWKMWTGAPYTWDDEWVARNPGLKSMSPKD